MDNTPRTLVAFCQGALLARGDERHVARTCREYMDAHADARILIFDARSSHPVELDLRGSVDDVLARLDSTPTDAPARRSPGRPKLGVVSREVTLLPRHWEWLASQRGGASATLRRLVDEARHASTAADTKRETQEAVYRIATAVAGDEPGFEEAIRALYANDADRFAEMTTDWPAGIRDHVRGLAAPVFSADEA